MRLFIERPHVQALVSQYPELDMLEDQLRFGNRAEISFGRLSAEQVGFLRNLYEQAGPLWESRAAQLASLHHILTEEGRRFEEHELEALLPVLAEYLLKDGIRGWLFRTDSASRPSPWVITRLDFTPPGDEEAGRILLELKANSCGKIAVETINIRSRDITGCTISQVLINKGYLKESPELIRAYDETTERYFRWRADYGRQFSARGTGIFAEDPTASHRNTDWSRKSRVVLSSSGEMARLVNDEEIIGERELSFEGSGTILNAYLRKAGKSARYDDKVESRMESARDEIPPGMFTELPVHSYILMFHLELHHHLWVHVEDMQPYEYRQDLREKLVLPREQTDLIDILTADMEVLTDDIIEGKSGGTTVLCAGPAGVGKTLTAEVYSEIIHKPLYRVHSGQLGLNVAEMERALKETLTRAQRWGAVMLIDEADVYIKRRDDNIAANAVVGVFLRVLEYFNGLLFLTTNRVNDIDEAIISRCIAVIRYHPPHREDRRRIWEVMLQQFSLQGSPTLVDELTDLFPDATGRDIKGLSKLVARYCKYKSVAPELDIFCRCAVFRGLEQRDAG